jgi:hypothetical protein
VSVPAPILDSPDGVLITRTSGLFDLFEEALVCANVLIEYCAREPRLRRHSDAIKVMREHSKNAADNYIPFAGAAAIPRGNARRLIYRLDKLTSLGVKLANIVKTLQTETAKIIVEKSKTLEENRKVIRVSVALLTEGKEIYE